MKIFWRVFAALAVLAVAVPAAFLFYGQFRDPQVMAELRENPESERAEKVMLMTLPSGRELPVNYLREGDRVYAGADGRWWQELVGDGFPVRVWIRGAEFEGRARAVLDDPEYTQDVFSRLRPTALPGFGTLIEIRIDSDETLSPPLGK